MKGIIWLIFDIGGGEMMVIMLFVLIFFGSRKIPEMARNLGKGIREIKDASNVVKREIQKGIDEVGNEIDKDINIK